MNNRHWLQRPSIQVRMNFTSLFSLSYTKVEARQEVSILKKETNKSWRNIWLTYSKTAINISITWKLWTLGTVMFPWKWDLPRKQAVVWFYFLGRSYLWRTSEVEWDGGKVVFLIRLTYLKSFTFFSSLGFTGRRSLWFLCWETQGHRFLTPQTWKGLTCPEHGLEAAVFISVSNKHDKWGATLTSSPVVTGNTGPASAPNAIPTGPLPNYLKKPRHIYNFCFGWKISLSPDSLNKLQSFLGWTLTSHTLKVLLRIF